MRFGSLTRTHGRTSGSRQRREGYQPRATPWGVRRENYNSALKGRRESPRALAGRVPLLLIFPGRCPGLICIGVFSAEPSTLEKWVRFGLVVLDRRTVRQPQMGV